ncbi:hypothetical protein RND71_000277 [Anisodus tanguticus]|uniref:Uncharacterized protein n=1 Tax=Anisodus tanguticus TaxID=243964 RepID=A0AAE1VXU5_9SOLA|nr:hypothetical protein RND71_000277 [Anisodus tanguticus]
MKASLILSLSLLLCLVNIQQCHGGEGDVLLKFLEARQTKQLFTTNFNEGQVEAEERVNSALGSIIPPKGSKEDDKISALPGNQVSRLAPDYFTGITQTSWSGDTDYIGSVTTSRYVIDKIKTPVKKSWYPWHFQGEVGGYAVEYQNLTFVTVRGSGHFVPGYQPRRALTLFSTFISGTLPPEYHK